MGSQVGSSREKTISVASELPSELLSVICLFATSSLSSIATLSQVERSWAELLRTSLYTRVSLNSSNQLYLFRRTIVEDEERTSNSTLSSIIKSLYINRPSSPHVTSDRILQLCLNANHLVLNLKTCYDPSPGLYQMKRLRQLTLIDLETPAPLESLVSKHNELILENMKRKENDSEVQQTINETPARIGISRIDRTVSETHGGVCPLKRLELVSFNGQAIPVLHSLTSLAHLVLTNPIPPARHKSSRGALPGLRILPRGPVILVLGSKRLERLIIRTTPVLLRRIVEELRPIEDDRLRFRIIESREVKEEMRWKAVGISESGDRTTLSENLSLEESGNRDLPILNLKMEWDETVRREEVRKERILRHQKELKEFQKERNQKRTGIDQDLLNDMDPDEMLSPWNSEDEGEDEDESSKQATSSVSTSFSAGSSALSNFSNLFKSLDKNAKPRKLPLPAPFADTAEDICSATHESSLKILEIMNRGALRVDEVGGLAFY